MTGARATGPRRLAAPLLLVAVLVGAVAIRLAAVPLPGHTGDALVVARWAERMAEFGPLGFYQDSRSIYPALLYLYWPLGAAFDGEALDTAIKALSIPFDVAIGILLYVVVSRGAGVPAGVGAASLYVLNPAVIVAGPMWGQIDAAGTLAFLATLVAAARRRYALAGGLGMLAGLVKPQFGLVLLPVLAVGAIAWREGEGWRPIARCMAGMAAAYVLIAGPLLLSPVRYVENVRHVADVLPRVSVLAPNPWALLVGYGVPDDGYRLVGVVLLALGLAASVLPLRRSRDLPALLVVGTLIVFASYFLPTRVHERYLFPAIALLAPVAAVSGRVLAAYMAMAAGFTLSLLSALAFTTHLSLPAPWEEGLISQPMVWGLSLLLIVSALTLVVQLSTGAGRPLAQRPSAT